jgi:hypothetical protein
VNGPDRTKRKKLVEIRVSYTVSAANGTVAVTISKDGGAYTSAISTTQTSTGEYVTKAQAFADGKAFDEGYEFQFLLQSTGNVSIKEFKYSYENLND